MVRTDQIFNRLKEMAIGGMFTFGLFVLSPLSLFAPLPGLIYLQRRGLAFGVLVYLTGLIPVVAFLGDGVSMLAAVSSTLTFFALGIVSIKRIGLIHSIAYACALALGLQLALMLVVGLWSPGGPIGFWVSYAGDTLDGIITATGDMSGGASWQSDGSMVEAVRFLKQNRELIISLLPGVGAITVIVEVWLNFIFVRLLDPLGYAHWLAEDVSRWRMPDQGIWLLIASLAMGVSGVDYLRQAGMNLGLIMLTVYFLQGLAIVAFYLRKFKIGPFFRTLLYFLIITPSPITLVVGGLGVFDFYFDLRRLDAPPGEDDEEDSDDF